MPDSNPVKRLLFTISLLGLQSCQTVQRAPSSDDAHSLFQERLAVQKLGDEIHSVQNKISTYPEQVPSERQVEYEGKQKLESRGGQLQEELRIKGSQVAQTLRRVTEKIENSSEQAPQTQFINFQERWRFHSETFSLQSLGSYKIPANSQPKIFYIADSEAKTIEVSLQQRVFTKNSHQERTNDYNPFLQAEVTCDQAFRLKTLFGTNDYRGGQSVKFKWFDSGVNSQDVKLFPSVSFSACRLTFSEDPGKLTYGVQFKPESKLWAALQLDQELAAQCLLPAAKQLKGIESFFMTAQFHSMTCPRRIQSVRALPDSYDGFNAKVKSLLGYELTKEQIDQQNPFMQVDFSRAPKLDAVFIGYLIFRNDFYGNFMRRLLEFHASRGAQVRVMISGALLMGKDAAMLREMGEKENIKVFPIQYHSQNTRSFKDLFDSFHRSLHVKMFITYSKSQPEYNSVVVGGRNFNDGFLFMGPAPNLQDFPGLVQYDKDFDAPWTKWWDLEVELKDPGLTKELIGLYMTLYNFDRSTLFFRSYNSNVETKNFQSDYFDVAPNEQLTRSFLSFPAKDDNALEKFYSDMFDAATESIKISSPYFRPTAKLERALKNAAARGVKIELVTRINLKGDTASGFITEVNKAGINAFMDHIKIYEFLTPDLILHTKLILIDGKLVTMGTVNLNQRSFYHDYENITLIYSPASYKEFNEVFEGYKAKSRLVEKRLKINWWRKIIIDQFSKEF